MKTSWTGYAGKTSQNDATALLANKNSFFNELAIRGAPCGREKPYPYGARAGPSGLRA
jgi:hypothetical protein